MDDFTPEKQAAIRAADKVIIGGNWFCLLDGALIGGAMSSTDAILYDESVGPLDDLSIVDNPEIEPIARRAELMLEAATTTFGLSPATMESMRALSVSWEEFDRNLAADAVKKGTR